MNIELTRREDLSAGSSSQDRMKLWSIVTSLTTGGAESLVVGLNSCFAQGGHDHTVISLCDAATLGNSPETELQLKEQIVQAGGRHLSLGLARNRNPITGARRINALLREDRPDLIHAHTIRAVPAIAVSRFDGAVVLTHHNSRLSFPPALFRITDRVVDSYVAISPETAETYRKHCRKPCTRISNGIPRQFIAAQPREAAGAPARVISVGTISAQKNYDLLITAAKAMQSDEETRGLAIFAVVGPGEELSDYRAKVEEADLGNVVEFLGARSDVKSLLSEADIYLNTSDYEGQSVAMLEAMAMALPIVATDVPGNRDIVSDGDNGSLVPHGNPQEIARAIARLARQPEFYGRCSARALEFGKGFSVEKTAAEHLKLYRSLGA